MPADRDKHRVEQADQKRAAKGGIRGVFDQGLADIEARASVQEAKARGDIGATQILYRLAGNPPDENDEATKSTTW